MKEESSREYFQSYRKKPSPVRKYVFYAVLAIFLIFIAYGLYHTYVQLENANLRQKIVNLNYKNMKCISLCPVIALPLDSYDSSLQRKNVRIHDVSCAQVCADLYQNYTSEEFSKAFPPEHGYDKQFLTYSESWRQCFLNLTYDEKFDYSMCYIRLFENLSQSIDLSLIRYVTYPSYSFSILSLTCADPATITLRSDSLEANTHLLFVLTDVSGSAETFKGFSAPPLRESQGYSLRYDSSEKRKLDSIGVAFLRAAGKQVTPFITPSFSKN